MTTLMNIVDEVSTKLSGYTMRQDRITHLTENVTVNDLSLHLGNVTNIGKGVIEIDDELLWVDSYDRTAGTVTIAPYGRGFNGTTATTHTAGAKVTIAPTFPRSQIRIAIQDTLAAIYPTLYAFGQLELTANPVVNTHAITDEIVNILYVSYQTLGPSKEWRPVRNWRHDPMAPHGVFSTTNTLTIYDNIPAGRKIYVHFTKQPGALVNDNDDFVTATGFFASVKDVIVYGAAYRLVSFIDPGRLNYTSAEADNADTKLQYGSASATARFFLSNYTQRLQAEQDKLRDLYPARIHYTRF